MASEVSVAWECDRCHARETTVPGKQPSGWSNLLYASPPKSAEQDRVGDVCRECWQSFMDWWNAESDIARPIRGQGQGGSDGK